MFTRGVKLPYIHDQDLSRSRGLRKRRLGLLGWLMEPLLLSWLCLNEIVHTGIITSMFLRDVGCVHLNLPGSFQQLSFVSSRSAPVLCHEVFGIRKLQEKRKRLHSPPSEAEAEAESETVLVVDVAVARHQLYDLRPCFIFL